MLNGISHMGFTVADLTSAVRFYTGVFGAGPRVWQVFDAAYTAEQVGYENARLDVAMFEVPGSTAYLELIQYLQPVGTPVDLETNNPGTAHLCLTSDDVAQEFSRLVGLGARPRSACPVLIDSGPNAGRRVAYLRDPQGITIELMEAVTAGAQRPTVSEPSLQAETGGDR